MNIKLFLSASLVVSAVFATGCTTTAGVGGSLVGDSYGSPAPRLVQDTESDSDKNALSWWYPQSFGPVPENLQSAGDAVCSTINFNKAIGYHPQAEDLYARPIPGGGYYCSR